MNTSFNDVNLIFGVMILTSKLFFKFKDISHRNILFIDAYIRVVNLGTHHKWIYADKNDKPDLIFCGEEPIEITGSTYIVLPKQNKDQEKFNPIDLNFFNFKRTLNSASIAIMHSKYKDAPLLHQKYSLLKCPPKDFINSFEKRKLASAIVKKPMSIYSLYETSGINFDLCQSFIDKLEKNGLLRKKSTNSFSNKKMQSPQISNSGTETYKKINPQKNPIPSIENRLNHIAIIMYAILFLKLVSLISDR